LTNEIEEYEEGLDDGEMLVTRSTLSGLEAPKNQDQKKIIFYTRCTVSRKVCSMIINGVAAPMSLPRP